MAGPGKSHRTGISLVQLFDMFPDEDSARKWFEKTRWPNGRACAKCGSIKTSEVPNATPMPYCAAPIVAPTSVSSSVRSCRAPTCRCASGPLRSTS